MLEKLDEIDWENVGVHVYGSHPQSEIPSAIREVLSENAEIREDALNFLFGQQQDIGDIHDTTRYIIPFIIEILDESSTPNNAEILQRLADISELHIYTNGTAKLSIHECRTQIQTYDALEIGVQIYLKFLKDENVNVRQLTVKLLGNLSDSATQIVPELIKQFDVETEEVIQITLVNGVGHLLSETDTRQIELRKNYAIWFRDLVENHPAQKVRVSAAQASIGAAVNALWNGPLTDEDLSPKVADVLREAYWDASDKQYIRQALVVLLTQLHDPEPLLLLLEHPDATPNEALLLVRAVLWKTFPNVRDIDEYWKLETYGLAKNMNIYDEAFQISEYASKNALKWQKQILERILHVDKIWSTPTNLFSFFFGLPDSRKGLSALIEEISSSIQKANY